MLKVLVSLNKTFMKNGIYVSKVVSEPKKNESRHERSRRESTVTDRIMCLLGQHVFAVPDTFSVIHEECLHCNASRGVEYYSIKIGY